MAKPGKPGWKEDQAGREERYIPNLMSKSLCLTHLSEKERVGPDEPKIPFQC